MKHASLKLNVEMEAEYFFRAAEGLSMSTRLESLSEEEIMKREADFMEHVVLVLLKNHYSVLTQTEWDAATEEDFLLTLPVNVRWTSMADSLLERTCWSQYPELAAVYPKELRSRILVCHRGISSTNMEGTFYGQKVELIIRYLLVGPILTVLVWLAKKMDVFGWFASKVAESDVGSFYVGQATDLPIPITLVGGGNGNTTKRYESSSAASHARGGNQADLVKINRRTFDKEFPNALTVIKKFFKTIKLQEACFRDVVVVYRQNESSCHKGEFSLRSGMKQSVIQNNIVMKRFSSIPLADMELVFPEKNVHFSPSTTVNIAVTVIGAIATLIFSIRGGLSLTSAWTSFTVLAGRVVQVYQTAATQKTEIEKSMGDIVSRRTVATQGAALSSIVNDMFSQLTRQIFLAYCVLVSHTRKGASMTVGQLDVSCERILDREFECTVDFTCEQAVDILKMWRVVSERDDGTLVPVSPSAAVRRLEKVLIVASKKQSATQSVVDSLAGVGATIRGVAEAGVGKAKSSPSIFSTFFS